MSAGPLPRRLRAIDKDNDGEALRPLSGGDEPPYPPDMEARVTRLEVEFEHVRKDLDEIKADQKATLAIVGKLATRQDLDNWKLQWLAVGLGAVVLIVTLTFGGIAILK